MHDEHLLSREERPVTIDGQPFTLTLYMATVGGTPTCVGMDLRTVSVAERVADGVLQRWAAPLGDDWHPITARALRLLDFTDHVEGMWRNVQHTAAAAPFLAKGETHGANVGPAEPKPTRGRPVETDDLTLASVAAAYLNAPRGQRVQAVAETLGTARGYTGPAERDQANKAIRRARDAGLLPAATYRRKAQP